MPTRRNPVVRAGAILRKGGVHRQSASGHRHQGRVQLNDEIDDWYDDLYDEKQAGKDLTAENALDPEVVERKPDGVPGQLERRPASRRSANRQNKGRDTAPDSQSIVFHSLLFTPAALSPVLSLTSCSSS